MKQMIVFHFFRSFRSVGDEIFIQSFEDATLPFENWTHEAHLRMAWNYIRDYGRDPAMPMIRWVSSYCAAKYRCLMTFILLH